MTNLIPIERVENKIYLIRGQKVMLDKDLAELYGVGTKVLNQAVRRNMKRFPFDFMFSLTRQESLSWSQIVTSSLRSQFVTSKRGGRRYLPYVFTEQGVSMLSSVLNSERAIQVNIAIMRAFVKLRENLYTHKEVLHKLDQLERKGYRHDGEIQAIFEAIQLMMKPAEKPRKRRGGE
ncbi:MAG: ORF6N domain-containing protein [Candidatus Saganbacteria bacterium]|nr:ORF6N domain-containing protein [Candidatus Saganbacteria bacterium]